LSESNYRRRRSGTCIKGSVTATKVERQVNDRPSEFSIIFGVLPSKIATAELVVPGENVSGFLGQAVIKQIRLT